MSLSAATCTPCTTSGSCGIDSGILVGMLLNTKADEPRISAPTPRVTMIGEISGCPTSRRRITRLKASPSATIPAHAKPRADAKPSPSAESPVATNREATITHSPSAKLIMRDALYTTTKASAIGV